MARTFYFFSHVAERIHAEQTTQFFHVFTIFLFLYHISHPIRVDNLFHANVIRTFFHIYVFIALHTHKYTNTTPKCNSILLTDK